MCSNVLVFINLILSIEYSYAEGHEKAGTNDGGKTSDRV